MSYEQVETFLLEFDCDMHAALVHNLLTNSTIFLITVEVHYLLQCMQICDHFLLCFANITDIHSLLFYNLYPLKKYPDTYLDITRRKLEEGE